MLRLSVLRLGRESTECAILLFLNVFFRFGMNVFFHLDFKFVLSQLLHADPW